jgi:hypothetical protein
MSPVIAKASDKKSCSNSRPVATVTPFQSKSSIHCIFFLGSSSLAPSLLLLIFNCLCFFAQQSNDCLHAGLCILSHDTLPSVLSSCPGNHSQQVFALPSLCTFYNLTQKHHPSNMRILCGCVGKVKRQNLKVFNTETFQNNKPEQREATLAVT